MTPPDQAPDRSPVFDEKARRRFASLLNQALSLAASFVALLLVAAAYPAQSQSSSGAAVSPVGEIENTLGMKLVRIEPGSFEMGQNGPPADYQMQKHPAKCDDADWDERPAHQVSIRNPFYMATTEVTLGQYRRFKPKWRPARGDNEAATAVSWLDAVEFCQWLSAREERSYRLPTEAEWEYACRAGTTTLFHTGNVLPADFQKWFGDAGRRMLYFPNGELPAEFQLIASNKPTLAVAQTPANAWGLFDMHGNVAEWCTDWYGPYDAGEQVDPSGRADGDFRVFRGGYHSSFTRQLRSANRQAWLPEAAHDAVGFRIVLAEKPQDNALPVSEPPLNARHVDQTIAEIQAPPADLPLFTGPKVFIRIPPGSAGPLFSRHNHSPTITECPNGDLLAAWFSCVDEGGSELNNLASRLRRGSSEWEPASPFWDGSDVNDHAPKLWWDGERTIFHFARGFAENIVRTSTDNGATWSKARIVLPHGEFGNGVVQIRGGTILVSHDMPFASLIASHDHGAIWMSVDATRGPSNFRSGGEGFRHAGIHAPVVQLADGRLMTIGRYDKPEDQERFGGKTPVSYSSDLGRTWRYEASEFPAISSAQRAVLIRLREGPLLLCSYTDQARDWKQRQGLPFKAIDGSQFTGYGLFAAVSFDDGRTWPARRLITPGARQRTEPTIDAGTFILSETMAEPSGYLAATQSRDGLVQLLSSKNHYVFNLAWLKSLPPPPEK